MPEPVIRVENLGKLYNIGALHKKYVHDTLRDKLAADVKNIGKHLFRRSKTMLGSESFWAVRNVSFDVKQGEVLGIIGNNGAGKSTLLKMLCRVTAPTEGRALLRGRVGSLLEVGTGFHNELTGRENIYLSGAILGMDKAYIDLKLDEIIAFSGIEQFIDTPVKRYSSGMRVRLGFAVAAHLEPEILLIDEVLAVGDIRFQKKCMGKMNNISKEGRTILYVSHNLTSINTLCNRAILLNKGEIQSSGPSEEIVAIYKEDSNSQISVNSLPKYNNDKTFGILSCNVHIKGQNNGYHNLIIDIECYAKRPTSNLGVGFSLSTINNEPVSILGPTVTGFVLNHIKGFKIVRMSCYSIDKYIAGGSYLLSLWLSYPGVSYILKTENSIRIKLPSADIYSTGTPFTYPTRGIVPLRFKMSIME